MKENIRKITLTGNVIAFVLSFVLLLFQVLSPLSHSMFDYNMRSAMSHQPHEDILVVGMDERSFESIGRFPWDREVYADFLEIVNHPDHAPKVIAFDVLFPSRTDEHNDRAFAETLAQYENVILPSLANLQNEFTRTTVIGRDDLITATELEKPMEDFTAVSRNAHINANIDSDGVIRRTWMQLNTPDDGVIDSLALKAARMYGADVDHFLEYHPQTELIIDFQANSYDFETISFVDVIDGTFPEENFQDRIVLIGFNAPATERDNRSTSVERDMMLVFAWANIINQLLEDTYVSEMSGLWILLISVILFALTVFITWKWRTITSLSVMFGGIAVVVIGQYLIYQWIGMYIDSVYFILTLFVTYLVNIAIKSFYENKQKNYITKQFGRYISPDLVKEIAASGQEIKLGGINKELSILFLDIRGFTTLSEKLKPEEVVDFLNTMFNLITEKALENHGTIDKFIGDAAMIVFNAPLDVKNHEYFAVKAAYDIQEGMQSVRDEIEEKYKVTISIGVGVHTGEVVIGNIGSYLRVDYTAIGDNVNIAARIESNTVANQILVSEETCEKTKEYFEYEYVGEKMMKGKSVPIKLYEVKAWKRGVRL